MKQTTLGDHLRKVRIQRKLSQPQVAKMINVSDETILSWEKNNTEPTPKDASKIIKFLGYFPFEWENESLSTKVRYARMVSGQTLRQMGKDIVVDASTMYKIFKNTSTPKMGTMKKITGYIQKYQF